MQNLAIAFLLWCSCAPLTSPEGAGLGDWHEPEAIVEEPSALESYLVARRGYGTDPRPDFVVDDHPEIVQAFGGYHIRPYFFKNSEDREMEAVYIAISEFQNDISIGRISSIQSEIDLEDTKGF